MDNNEIPSQTEDVLLPLARAMGELQQQIDSVEFSPKVYEEAGVFVLREAIALEQVQVWQAAWRSFVAGVGVRRTNPYNSVAVLEVLPDDLAQMHHSPSVLDVVERVYPDLALYEQRFVVKDAVSRGAVFLHQDYGYNRGWPEKTSVFVPLSHAGPDNGGLLLYPGTHRLGYLGDAGELDPACLPEEWPVICPSLEPGDFVLMHDCLWHGSRPHTSGVDRVLAQLTYQPADDPSSVSLLRGRWRTGARVGELDVGSWFKRSRSQRLRELQAEVDRLGGSP